MPTYEYRCNCCRHEFEIEQRISDPHQADCPMCGSSDTNRLISRTSFILKGTGWYVTDYARKSTTSSTSPSEEKKTKANIEEKTTKQS